MKKRKIVFVITKGNWGGAQRYVYDLATGYADAYDVAVVTGGTENGRDEVSERLVRRLQDSGVRAYSIPSLMRDISPWRDMATLGALVRLFRRERPEIVHLNSPKAAGLGALAGRLARVPLIVTTVHGLPSDEDRGFFARILIGLTTWVSFLLAHRIIVLSKDNLIRSRRYPFCSRKVVLIRNGIARITNFESREAARARLGIEEKTGTGTLLIGTIAEMTRNKGLTYLVDAMEKLGARGVAARLVLIGDGEERERLATQIRAQGLDSRVQMTGFLDEANRYLKAFDVFVLPSVKEGLPYVLLEAGQAACAVVASRIPGVEDIVEDGISGLLFEKKNSTDLAEKLETLIADEGKRQKTRDALEERVKRGFSLETMRTETERVYCAS